MAEQQGFISFLPDLGVIAATGEDASDFLHNQLTNDVLGLSEDSARLAGYCSPKGRLLATMLVWKAADSYFLMLPKSLLAATQKRLQMFVLRAKVKLEDASDRLSVAGIGLPSGAGATVFPAAAYQRGDLAEGVMIRMPDAAGFARALWVGPASQAPSLNTVLPSGLTTASASLWRWTDIQAGLPQILEATREQFVPQMVNFELVGGVNFRKGCYPGQEIVARSQYLGKLKRRMLLSSVDALDALDAPEAAPGTEVYSDSDPGQPCGMIVNAERGPDARLACLVELKMEMAESGAGIRLGSPSGPPLQFSPLPYSLDATV